MVDRMAFRYGAKKSGCEAGPPEKYPPDEATTKVGLSFSEPSLPWGVDLKVRPTRTTWSIHALRLAGTV